MSPSLTAILSDVHGNLAALERAVADALARGARRFVCLGDVVGYGARPRQCLDLVMRLCSPEPVASAVGVELDAGLCLLGNHEHALLSDADGFNPMARAAIDWTRDEIDGRPLEEPLERYRDFLARLEPRADHGTVMFAHGSPRDPLREYVLPVDIHKPDKMRGLFDSMSASVCFVGHSHVPAVYHEDSRLYRPYDGGQTYHLGDLARARAIVNVGSVGQPRDGDPRLCYVLFDGESVAFVRIEYDLRQSQQDILAIAQLPSYLAERLAVGR